MPHDDDDKNDRAGAGGGGDAYALPQLQGYGYRSIIETIIRNGLLANPLLDADGGAWWTAPQFEPPWWDHPPPVEGI